ncbi:hypothetical protein [Lentibacillus jeotgali]|uniref:hypothetical protein n=1 Tax=Lentibacillus jeotgali TaxID=558169 RepID=UPI00026292FC|nr:hypothetical protein [Lentibacillus jeotgali]
MKKHLFWILPSIVMITGIFLMLNQSISDVTERLEQDWSRVMTEIALNNDVELNVYQLNGTNAKRVHAESFQIDAMQTVFCHT